MLWMKNKARVEGAWLKSSKSLGGRGGCASREPHTGAMHRWLFRAAVQMIRSWLKTTIWTVQRTC